jgi:phospholipid transport system transporter-binding protein
MQNHADVVLENQELYVSGNLDFANVMPVLAKGLAFYASQPTLVFNFDRLKTSNSAGLALILEWISHAKSQKKSIKFKNISPKLMAIANTASLGKIIDVFSA